MGLAMRQVDLERLDRALTTLLSPLAHQCCDDWCLAVESSVAELLDGDHVVFGLPRAGVPMHVHSMNVAANPRACDPDALRQAAGPAAGSLASEGGARAAAVGRRGVEPASCILGGGRRAARGTTALELPRRGSHARADIRQREHRLGCRRRTHRAVYLVQQRRDVTSFAPLEPKTCSGSAAPTSASRPQGGSHHASRG